MIVKFKVGLANSPRFIGKKGLKECLNIARKSGASVICVNEVFSPNQVEGLREWAHRRGWKLSRTQSPNPILWNPKIWDPAPTSGKIKLHDKAPGPLAKKYPGYNSARYMTRQPLRHKKSGEVVTFFNTHLAAWGPRVDGAWSRAMRERSRKRMARLVRTQIKQGRWVVGNGDMNTWDALPLPRKFKWTSRTVLRQGAAPRAGKNLKISTKRLNSPSDHGHQRTSTVRLYL